MALRRKRVFAVMRAMLRWSLLSLAVMLLGTGLLTVGRVPDGVPWRLAVAAGVYGHVLALGAVTIAVAAWWMSGAGAGWAITTGAVALAAAGLLLRPAMSARRVADEAKSALDRMGAPAGSRSGFEVRRLFARETTQVPVETRRVGEGLEFDFYRAVGNAKAPCVIVVHGGGWDGGDRKQMPELNHWLAGRGYAVAAVSYRLAPQHRWPAQRDDVRAAIAWIKAHAEELGVDAARLVLFGRSAGGQIALNVAYTASDPAIRGAIGLYAPADLILGYESGREDDALGSRRLLRQYLGGTPEEVRAVYDDASATTRVTRESPPTLLLHGKLDTLVWERHTERLAAKLKEHDVPHAVVWVPWATHAFEYELNGPGGQVTLYAIERFLEWVTR
jgi:acetyl esterase/lipase